jgi:ribosomal protein L11 methyltransferase
MREKIEEMGYAFTENRIQPQNWNAAWEAGFSPVIVPGFCTVRADFHEPVNDTPYEIVITPKMSFGTGHHATTRLMMAAMRGMDFNAKRVLDFGTGTGILAILASKLGAREITAIDNDEWSVENSLENVAANGAQNISVLNGSLEITEGVPPFTIILANINRHILLQYLQQMKAIIVDGGELLLSGILQEDEQIITQAALNVGFRRAAISTEGDWIALKFTA